MIRRVPAALLAALALAWTTVPAGASSVSGHAAALAALQAKDTRLQSTGWRLATGNARFCGDARLASGLLLHDVTAYDRPDDVRRAAGLGGDIAVQAVAEGSPAALADLRANDEVLAVSRIPVASLPRSDRSGRTAAVDGLIAAGLARDGEVLLTVRNATGTRREVALKGVRACAARFEIVTGRDIAQADGERVLIGERFGEAADPADALAGEEYAAIVAHELAHNLLGHRQKLDRIGRSAAHLRSTEREADRLSVWLLLNAGIAPEIALGTAESWRRRKDAGLLRVPTHAGWRERRAILAEEIGRLRATLVSHGEADWSRWFQRED